MKMWGFFLPDNWLSIKGNESELLTGETSDHTFFKRAIKPKIGEHIATH
jgi:hypothetical protein